MAAHSDTPVKALMALASSHRSPHLLPSPLNNHDKMGRVIEPNKKALAKPST
jgi:hypothetical protein